MLHFVIHQKFIENNLKGFELLKYVFAIWFLVYAFILHAELPLQQK